MSLMYLQSSIVIFFFFFFQAEDGIRDWSVTGVQTCALPISTANSVLEEVVHEHAIAVVRAGEDVAAEVVGAAFDCRVGFGLFHQHVGGENIRSEERRVGKECRSRWSPYH